MKKKSKQLKNYHFKKLPYPPQLTIDEADNSVNKINNLAISLRNELHDFDARRGYLLLGYKNMPAFIKSKIPEISARNAHELIKETQTEIDFDLNMPVGTVPYLALKLLNLFSVDVMKKLWIKATLERLTGEGIISALRRVIDEYNVTKL